MEKQHSYTTGSLTPTEPLKSLGSLSPSLSCSNSSLASNYSSVSIDSNSTCKHSMLILYDTESKFLFQIATSLSNQIAIHLMFYNSIEIISRRYAMEEISFRVATMDMTSVFESTMDEDIDGGDEYPTEIAVMNNVEYKFHQQIRNGRQVLKNELVLFRSRMPYTDQVVSYPIHVCIQSSYFDLRVFEWICFERQVKTITKRLLSATSIHWTSIKAMASARCQSPPRVARLSPVSKVSLKGGF